MFEDAYRNYLLGFNEIRFLLKQAKTASISLDHKMKLANQQVFLRSAIVLMAARLEAFLKLLPEVYSDAVIGDWSQQGKGQKKFLSVQIARNLTDLLNDDKVIAFEEERNREFFKREIEKIVEVYGTAERHTNLRSTTRLVGFYKLNSIQAIEKFLSDFRDDNTPFFGWLHKQGYDGGRYKTVVEGLLIERNSVAHGSGTCSLTLGEVRSYLAVITHMVRLILLYLKGAGS